MLVRPEVDIPSVEPMEACFPFPQTFISVVGLVVAVLSTLSLLQFLIVLIPCHVAFPCVGSHVVVFFVGGAGAGIPLAAGGYQG